MNRFLLFLLITSSILVGCNREVTILVTPGVLSPVPEFDAYEGDGYLIVIPVSAEIVQAETHTEFIYQSADGNYTMRMEPLDSLPNFSPETILQGMTTDVIAPSEIEAYTINAGEIAVARRSYTSPNAGEYCATVTVLETVFAKDDAVFLMQMVSDAPNACEVQLLEDTDAIISSTRIGATH